MDALAEIKHLYYNATRGTITRDLIRAVTLLKTMLSEEDRERAAVYMDGLSQMRSEWAGGKVQRAKGPKGSKGRGSIGPRVQGSRERPRS